MVPTIDAVVRPATDTLWRYTRVSYQVGDRVRVVIPDASDPDHQYHAETGRIEEVLQDDLSGINDDPRDDFLYRVTFDDESLGRMSFRHHDLRLENEDEE